MSRARSVLSLSMRKLVRRRRLFVILPLIFTAGVFLLLYNFFPPSPHTKEVAEVNQECKHLSLSDASSSEKLQCWEKLMQLAVKHEGLKGAYEIFGKLYQREPLFAQNCHDFNHILGEAAYERFIQGKDFFVTGETIFCSFGFYHGFMQSLVGETGDIDRAREFCSYVDARLKGKTTHAGLACYHGIGHGFIDEHYQKAQGDERAMVKPALKLCEEVSQTGEQLFFCATGVFDSISYAYYNHLYGLTMSQNDPLWLCREQPERYKLPCYADSMPGLLWLGGHDLARSAAYIEDVQEDIYAIRAMRSLADDSVRFFQDRKDYARPVFICRSLQKRLKEACISGLAGGYMQFAQPRYEYIDGLKFCRAKILTTEERVTCFKEVIGYAKQLYPREKLHQICKKIDEPYQIFCRE
ncbi:MAG: hypothetical protein HY001_04325 [Candidatus Portnoybacteria bacterium]|nr:hypothetical protein [Candidatus Portnoybacteria bacterium]